MTAKMTPGPPEMWLVGCTHSLERRGLNPKQAIIEALRIWNEQTELAARIDGETGGDK